MNTNYQDSNSSGPKFCTNCGNKLLSEAKFCTHCGKEIIQTSTMSSKPKPIPPKEVAPPPVQPVRQEVKKAKKKTSFSKFIFRIAFILLALWGIKYAYDFWLSETANLFKENHFLQAKMKVDENKTLGDLKQEGWTLAFEDQTFEEEVDLSISISTAKKSQNLFPVEGGQIVGGILDVKAMSQNGELVYLNKPVKISMNLGKKPKPAEMVNYMVGCFVDGEWHLIHPDAKDLAQGIISFETNHFTPYGTLKLDDEKLIKKLADDYAIKDWSKGNSREQIMARIEVNFKNAFKEFGIKDAASQKRLILNIKLNPKFGQMVDKIDKGENVDIQQECAKLSSDALLIANTNFPGSGAIPYLGTYNNIKVGIAQLKRGDYQDAMENYLKAFSSSNPLRAKINTLTEISQKSALLRKDFDEFSNKISFNAYLRYIGGQDKNLHWQDDEWKKVMYATYGNEDLAKVAAIKDYALRNGIPINDVLNQLNVDKIYETFNKNLIKEHKERYRVYMELKGGEKDYEKIIRGFIKDGLLIPGKNGYPIGESLDNRLDDLLTKRDYILNLFGGKMPILALGESAEQNLNEAIVNLIFAKDNIPEFMKWLNKKGYIHSEGKIEEEEEGEAHITQGLYSVVNPPQPENPGGYRLVSSGDGFLVYFAHGLTGEYEEDYIKCSKTKDGKYNGKSCEDTEYGYVCAELTITPKTIQGKMGFVCELKASLNGKQKLTEKFSYTRTSDLKGEPVKKRKKVESSGQIQGGTPVGAGPPR